MNEPGRPAVFEKHNVTPGFGRQKNGLIDLLDRPAKKVQGLAHENTNVRSTD
jgi:hypothetical protein